MDFNAIIEQIKAALAPIIAAIKKFFDQIMGMFKKPGSEADQ